MTGTAMNYSHATIRKATAKVLDVTDLRFFASYDSLLLANEGLDLTIEDIRLFLTGASEAETEPLVSYIRSAWAASTSDIRSTRGVEGEPYTDERLEWVLSAMGIQDLGDEVRGQLTPPNEAPVVVSNEFTNWYTAERQAENANYWHGYREVLRRNGWKPEAIQSVSDNATEVLRRITDPWGENPQATRGLVVGYVQSGKTANFTAVAAKAIDAGYRVIIVLAGTLNMLREQTQRRLDKELLGRTAILDGLDEDSLDARDLRREQYFQHDVDWEKSWVDEEPGAFIEHGPGYGSEGFPTIKRVTTSLVDFQRSQTNAFRWDGEVNPDRMPCLVAVVKKNAAVLRNLNKDIRKAQNLNPALAQLPVLVIDDESDQASVNTKQKPTKADAEAEQERTAINAEIVELMRNFECTQYLGYTATPAANVFIDPTLPEDLFPRDYVLSLPEPPAYRGARWFHDREEFRGSSELATIENSQSMAFIRDIAANVKGKDKEEKLDPLTREEYREALDMFVLTGAVKKFREAKDPTLKFKHHTMLVHEKLGTSDHRRSKLHLMEIWRQRSYITPIHHEELRALFEDDLLPVMRLERYNEGYPVPADFDELRPYIAEAYAQIMEDSEDSGGPVLEVNYETKETPNFDAAPVWKIMVGGAKLSRGYTVEGLTVSLFRRHISYADTLMQAGRWFGFRKGYQDLVRLYAPEDTVARFEAAMAAEQAFRTDIRGYAQLDEDGKPVLTPDDMAPLVYQYMPDLKPTSPNKMQRATLAQLACAPSPRAFGSIPLREDRDALEHNFTEVTLPLLQSLTADTTEMLMARQNTVADRSVRGYTRRSFHTGTVSADVFIELLDQMQWRKGSSYKQDTIAPHLAYLRSLVGNGRHANHGSSDFTEVAVLLPAETKRTRKKAGHLEDVPGVGFDVPLVSRGRTQMRIHRRDASADVLPTIAQGLSPLELRDEIIAGLHPRESETYQPLEGEEPFDLSPEVAFSRGAVLLTLFDDRDLSAEEKMPKSEKYTPPKWDKGEVGVQLTFNSPHAALHGAGSVTILSVRREPLEDSQG